MDSLLIESDSQNVINSILCKTRAPSRTINRITDIVMLVVIVEIFSFKYRNINTSSLADTVSKMLIVLQMVRLIVIMNVFFCWFKQTNKKKKEEEEILNSCKG